MPFYRICTTNMHEVFMYKGGNHRKHYWVVCSWGTRPIYIKIFARIRCLLLLFLHFLARPLEVALLALLLLLLLVRQRLLLLKYPLHCLTNRVRAHLAIQYAQFRFYSYPLPHLVLEIPSLLLAGDHVVRFLLLLALHSLSSSCPAILIQLQQQQ